TMSPSTYDFGNVLVGQQSPGQDFFVANNGTGTATLGPLSLTGDFNLVTSTCSGVLAPSATCKVTVAFAPSLPGLRTGSVTMLPTVTLARGNKVTAGGGALASASLKGTGTQQALLDMPSAVDFGSLT